MGLLYGVDILEVAREVLNSIRAKFSEVDKDGSLIFEIGDRRQTLEVGLHEMEDGVVEVRTRIKPYAAGVPLYSVYYIPKEEVSKLRYDLFRMKVRTVVGELVAAYIS